MNHVGFRKTRPEVYVKFKSIPTFPLFKNEEFRPCRPCVSCFPNFSCDEQFVEQTGVRNLFQLRQLGIRTKFLHFLLTLNLKSLQIHWSQVENLAKVKNQNNIFLVRYQSEIDLWVLSYLAHILQFTPSFVNYPKRLSFAFQHYLHSYKKFNNNLVYILFINLDEAEIQLDKLIRDLKETNENSILVSPLSISYEFQPDNVSWNFSCSSLLKGNEAKPHTRINFGFYRPIDIYYKETETSFQDVIGHMTHELWLNTPITAMDVVSVARYHPCPHLDQLESVKTWLNEFRNNLQSTRDLAYGDLDLIAGRCLNLLSNSKLQHSSIASDLLKLESLMIKASLQVIDWYNIDHHEETYRVSKDALLSNFRSLSEILRYELKHLNPPCAQPATIENETLHSLSQRGIISHQSDEIRTIENQRALKIATHLDFDCEEETDEFWDDEPVRDVKLYVHIPNLSERKWMVRIVDEILLVYYMAAKQLMFLRDDVVEDASFVASVLESLRESFGLHTSNKDTGVVYNSLKLFQDMDLLDNYSHSGVKIVYLKDTPGLEDKIFQLIDNIVQFL